MYLLLNDYITCGQKKIFFLKCSEKGLTFNVWPIILCLVSTKHEEKKKYHEQCVESLLVGEKQNICVICMILEWGIRNSSRVSRRRPLHVVMPMHYMRFAYANEKRWYHGYDS